MKKIFISALFALILLTNVLESQENTQPYRPKPDDWGSFCLVSYTHADTNYFKIDLKQIVTEFEKIYLKYYYLEQDVFHTKIIYYNIEASEALIAVPKRYDVEEYKHFMATMKKMAFTANYNFNNEERATYLENHKNK
jgi:hypothetical protein